MCKRALGFIKNIFVFLFESLNLSQILKKKNRIILLELVELTLLALLLMLQWYVNQIVKITF